VAETKADRIAKGRPINERALLTKQDAADYLSVSLSTFKRFVTNRDIKPIHVVSRAMFRRTDLDELIDKLATGETAYQKAIRP
jgi:excisionase family DNA binding protein